MDPSTIVKSKPFLTYEQASELVREKFQLRVKKMKPLAGYDNQNFRIETIPMVGDECTECIGEDAEVTTTYTLKVMNSALSKEGEQIRDATLMMEFLRKEGFLCPRPIPDKTGNLCKLRTFKNLTLHESGNKIVPNKSPDDTFIVRMSSFLPGVTLCDLSVVPNHIFEEAGEILGRLHNALERMDIDPQPMKEFASRSNWSLGRVGKMVDILDVVKDPKRNKLCREVIGAFSSNVQQISEKLPQGFLHGDYNDTNILVSEPTDDKGEIHVTGFIDFDDSHYGPAVFDVGITLMYLLQCKTPKPDTGAKLFLRGYLKHRRLSHLELSCLYYVAVARFVQSLVIGLKTYAENKDEYVLETQARGWSVLEDLWCRGREDCYRKWEVS